MKNRNSQLIAVLFVMALALAPIVQAAPHLEGGPTYSVANDAPIYSVASEAPQFGGGPANEPRPALTPRARPIPASRPDSSPANEAPQPGGIPTKNPPPASTGSTVVRPPANEAPDQQMPAISIHSTGDVNRGKTGSFVLDMKPALLLGAMFVNFNVSGSAIPGVDYVALVSPAYIGQSGYGTILVQTLPDPRGSSNRQSYSVVVTLESGPGYELGAPSSATMWIKP